nr:DUF927 domain-containing protein [Kibdelosporangium sp. MJ126-NF4]CEL19674.1 hypothetical protein [Kibdelosporangium sp. MJ126-NF4]CTQ94526.1 hypothetical protein [Kibdelosporangium sp. MJ126-NF4]
MTSTTEPATDQAAPGNPITGVDSADSVTSIVGDTVTDTVDGVAVAAWAQGCDAIPARYRVSENYEITEYGVYTIKTTKDGEQRTRVTYAPLLPVGVFIAPDGGQMLELVWKDHQRWVNRVVARSIAKSGRKLIAALGDAGLPAVDADAKALERWLAAAEATNRWVIPRRPLARWLGWQPDGTFVSAAGQPTRVEPVYDDQAAAIAAHHEHGTLADWQAGLAVIEPYPVAKVAVYAGFAACLLQLVGVDSFTIDISGRSTRGKTTAAKLGLSVWADPAEKGDGLFSWRSSLIAIEKRLNICRGLPVVIDETRVVKFPELVDQVIYQVPKNHGQARGGGWPNLLPWSTIVISTGEQSALSFTTHQGAAARVLSLQRPPFSGGDDDGLAASTVGKAVDDNYGLAGPAFIARLHHLLAPPNKQQQLRARHTELTAQFRGETDMSGRRAPMVACIALAAELVHQWGLVPFEPLPEQTWQELFTTTETTDDRPQMALDVVREFVAAHANQLWRPGTTEHSQPSTGWIGRHYELDNQPTVALLPERLRDALNRSGYVLDAVLPGWQELRYLAKFGHGHGAYQPVRAIAGAKTRMYVFTPGIVLDDHDDEHSNTTRKTPVMTDQSPKALTIDDLDDTR